MCHHLSSGHHLDGHEEPEEADEGTDADEEEVTDAQLSTWSWFFARPRGDDHTDIHTTTCICDCFDQGPSLGVASVDLDG